MSSTEDWLDEILKPVFAYGIDWQEFKDESENDRAVSTFAGKIKDEHRSEAKAKIRQHMLSEAIELIGDDEKEFTKRSRPNDNSDTDKLWDLANGVEPISSSQFSTWGSSANAQFRKFALKLRNTIWREAELHNNELKAELRQAFTEKYGGLDIKTGNGAFDNQRADINDLIELVVYELEYQRHPIQEYSHDQYCERCQDPATYGCYVTNKKIGNRIRELRKQPTNALL